MLMSGAQILIEELINQGVDTVFGYPGGSVLNIYDELYKNSERIQHIITAHEQGAAHAADGYARAKAKPGVVIATSGPGATNLVTGIANAYLDSVPMVAITGNVPVALLSKDSFQEVDIVGITMPIIKHNFIVRDIKHLQHTIREAFKIAMSDRPGPVLVDIPKNIQIETFEYEESDNANCNKNSFDEISYDKENFELAVKEIKSCRKPYIYCGGGVINADACDEVLKLSQKIGAPIGFSMMGLTAVDSSYDLYLGMCGMHGKYAASMAQAECDLMIAIGVRFSDRATGKISEYTKKCTVIHIDIDEAEINKNVISKIGVCGDVKSILKNLIDNVDEYHNLDWIKQIKIYKKVDKDLETEEYSPQSIIRTVNSVMDNNTVVATDVGQHQMWTVQHYKFSKPRTLLTSGGLGTMGYGMGAAIGGCIANDKQRTVLFTSDGSFGMNLNELATAVSQKLPLVIILMNNGVLGMVRQWQTMFYGQRYAETTLERKTDFIALAKAFGADAYRVNDLEGLKEALKNTKMDSPCVIECIIDMDEMVYPMIPPGESIKKIVLKGD